MTNATLEKQYAHIGETSGVKDHDHDLITFLACRSDAIWHADQRIANAEGDAELQSFWRAVKKQDLANIERARALVKEHVRKDCF